MVVVGLSHRTAPVEVRENLAIPKEQMAEVLGRLAATASIAEVMCISTCNRVEIVATATSGSKEALEATAADVATVLEDIGRASSGISVRPHLYRYLDQDAVKHLFRVASSLDSIVVGEPQILGQVKDAFEAAQSAGVLGPTLTRTVTRALHAAKRVRTETAIGEGLVSVSSVAIDLAHQIFDDLRGKKTMLVGAGEMAEAAAQLLSRAGASVLVVNRSPERGAELAHRIGGSPRPWEELPSALTAVDVVVSSTSSRGFVLTFDMVQRAMKLRRGKTLFLIDIAVPRDIEPSVNSIDGVFLYDVDDLEKIVEESQKGRAEEAQHAERILGEELKLLDAWVEARGVTPTIVGLRQKTRAVLAGELERSLSGKLKHLTESDRKSLEQLMDAAVNKLLHAPTAHLRKAASEPRGEQMARVVRELFELPDVAVMADAEPKRDEEKKSS